MRGKRAASHSQSPPCPCPSSRFSISATSSSSGTRCGCSASSSPPKRRRSGSSTTYARGDWNLEFDAGELYPIGVAKLISRFPRYWREIQAFDTRWPETFGPIIEGTVAIQDELIAAGLKTYAITNFSWEKWITRLPEWPFLEKFEGIIVSGLEDLVKPDPRIYRVFCERFGFEPEQCVFLDDSEPNISAARKFGMQAVHFRDAAQARADLIAVGLPLKA